MAEDKPVTQTIAIKKYFLATTPLTEVMKEIKALSPEDKKELAEGAAKELGLTLAE